MIDAGSMNVIIQSSCFHCHVLFAYCLMNTVKLEMLLFSHTGFRLYIVRKKSIFGCSHHILKVECKKYIGYTVLDINTVMYHSPFIFRVFLRSGWGWTCIFVGSFVFILSFSVRRSLTLSLRHLSRLAVASGLWLGFRKLLCLLENATGSCYEPLSSTLDLASGTNGDQPLLLL